MQRRTLWVPRQPVVFVAIGMMASCRTWNNLTSVQTERRSAESAGAAASAGAPNRTDRRTDESAGSSGSAGASEMSGGGRYDVFPVGEGKDRDTQSDDCSALSDAQLALLGTPCFAGEGACESQGTYVCVDGGVACGAVAGSQKTESCNGVDDDCDGETDEDVPSEDCDGGPGVCAEGTTECVDGQTSCKSKREPSREKCDGIDNDCDGLIDVVIEDDVVTLLCNVPCEPVSITLDDDKPFLSDKASEREGLCDKGGLACSTLEHGMAMDFCVDCVAGTPWMVCQASTGVDMTPFDLAHDGNGALAVEFCVEGDPLPMELNLWYGRHPDRKKLQLKSVEEELGPGCYTRLLAPEDACNPGYDTAQCKKPACGQDAAGCKVPDLDAAPMTLAAETACLRPAQGRIELRSVTYYPSQCLCLPGDVCPGGGGRICQMGTESTLPHPRCPDGERCAGVCAEVVGGCEDAAWVGEACEMVVGEQTCPGTLSCAGNSAVCTAADCV